MKDSDVRALELELLVEAIFRRYGYDFRDYARAALMRRFQQVLASTKEPLRLSDLIPRILYDPEFFGELASDLTISTTEMFRDPPFFVCFRERIVPILKTYPFLKIWHPGCSTGQEVYSMAILLHEEGVLDRCVIYATDINARSLSIAREGIYAVSDMQSYTRHYNEAGGKASLGDYYHAQYRAARMAPFLRNKITFATHNLATDQVFGEMNFVSCRNVLIYFQRNLQERAVRLFWDSLCPLGFFCLGMKETLMSNESGGLFDVYASRERIYRRKQVVRGSGESVPPLCEPGAPP